jgi:hypothetical protein
MTSQPPPTVGASAASASATSAPVPSQSVFSGTSWQRGGFLLAGAAQLITISALLSADPLAATWSALLLAIAPAPLAAVAAFARPGVARLAALAAAVGMLVGIVGGIGRIGTLFIPALIAVVIGGARLWLADRK